MKLCEHDGFETLIIDTAERTGLDESFIEKDYYITEILRIVQREVGPHIIFKGGTSLSKGWGLITRFSEDVDLFLNPASYPQQLGKSAIDKTFRRLSQAIEKHQKLTWLTDENQTIKGLGRADYFEYPTLFKAQRGIRNAVRVEPGIQSGVFPTQDVPITSHVAQTVKELGLSLDAEDSDGFTMTLLHFRRTFVEKLFTVHGKVERMRTDPNYLSIGRDARHYSDLHALAQRPEIREMLASEEYDEICRDYDANSQIFYPRSYRPPTDLRFRNSPALFPSRQLRESLEADYVTQCNALFVNAEYPSFDEVLKSFQALKASL